MKKFKKFLIVFLIIISSFLVGCGRNKSNSKYTIITTSFPGYDFVRAIVKDGDIDVKTFVKNNGGTIKAMYRFEVGEGMQKREENFAEEVMKQMK